MKATEPEVRLLQTLFLRSQNNERIDILALAEAAQLSVYAALKAVSSLSECGLVDRQRLRLTLRGVAVASCVVPAGWLNQARESRPAVQSPLQIADSGRARWSGTENSADPAEPAHTAPLAGRAA